MTIIIDPLGGAYYDEKAGEWKYQRRQVYGMHADLITVAIAGTAGDILRTVGVNVESTRSLRHSYREKGESGKALFQEAAYLHLRTTHIRPDLRAEGAGPEVPDWVTKDGETNLERDGRCRANYARLVKPDLLLGIDITNYVEDAGFEVAHNGVGRAADAARNVLSEITRRTRRKSIGIRDMLDEQEAYRELDVPAVIVNCGSAFDPHTAHLLRQPYYRECLALGMFAGLWKSGLAPAASVGPAS